MGRLMGLLAIIFIVLFLALAGLWYYLLWIIRLFLSCPMATPGQGTRII